VKKMGPSLFFFPHRRKKKKGGRKRNRPPLLSQFPSWRGGPRKNRPRREGGGRKNPDFKRCLCQGLGGGKKKSLHEGKEKGMTNSVTSRSFGRGWGALIARPVGAEEKKRKGGTRNGWGEPKRENKSPRMSASWRPSRRERGEGKESIESSGNRSKSRKRGGGEEGGEPLLPVVFRPRREGG